MSTKAIRHVHKYNQIKLGPDMVWACALPLCNHYMPKYMEAMINGKASECWNCDNKTIMSESRMQFAIENNEGRMLCDDCMRQHEVEILEHDEVLAKIERGEV